MEVRVAPESRELLRVKVGQELQSAGAQSPGFRSIATRLPAGSPSARLGSHSHNAQEQLIVELYSK
jgi:hypothetical protein